jgi:hypothetical protein
MFPALFDPLGRRSDLSRLLQRGRGRQRVADSHECPLAQSQHQSINSSQSSIYKITRYKINMNLNKTLTVEVTSRSQVIVDSLTRYMHKQGYKKVGLMAGLGYYDLIFVLKE